MQPEGSKAPLDELAALYPQPRTVTIAGRAVEIQPSTIRAGARVLHLAQKMWALRQSEEEDELTLADEHPEEAAALLFAATGLDIDWLSGLAATDKVELGLAWMEVNGAFFVLRPFLLRVRMGKAVNAMFGRGLTSSPVSSETEAETPGNSHQMPPESGLPLSDATSSAVGATH